MPRNAVPDSVARCRTRTDTSRWRACWMCGLTRDRRRSEPRPAPLGTHAQAHSFCAGGVKVYFYGCVALLPRTACTAIGCAGCACRPRSSAVAVTSSLGARSSRSGFRGARPGTSTRTPALPTIMRDGSSATPSCGPPPTRGMTSPFAWEPARARSASCPRGSSCTAMFVEGDPLQARVHSTAQRSLRRGGWTEVLGNGRGEPDAELAVSSASTLVARKICANASRRLDFASVKAV